MHIQRTQPVYFHADHTRPVVLPHAPLPPAMAQRLAGPAIPDRGPNDCTDPLRDAWLDGVLVGAMSGTCLVSGLFIGLMLIAGVSW